VSLAGTQGPVTTPTAGCTHWSMFMAILACFMSCPGQDLFVWTGYQHISTPPPVAKCFVQVPVGWLFK